MNSKKEQAIMVLFGATGDLAKRKLFPALYSLFTNGQLASSFKLIGLGRREMTNEAFLQHVLRSLEEFSRIPIGDNVDAFLTHLQYCTLDINNTEEYTRLLDLVQAMEAEGQFEGNRLFYLAITPDLFSSVTSKLHQSGLLNTKGWKRLIIEKPFGHDLSSAQRLNDEISEVFREEEIFRIDHYLGKEMIQNIEVIRFANSFFEPVWNNQYISNIQLTSSETVGVENRGGYYDKAGALRDMVQNHMLQMVTMIAMEPPSRLKPEAIRDEKVKVLRSIRRFESQEEVNQHVVRGQYEQGLLEGEQVKGYRQEENVDPHSSTATFVAAKLMVDNFRWAGVPFYIRTGKRLAKKATEIIIQFKNLPYLYFNKEGNLEPNLLVIRIYPEEGIHLKLNAKKPGTDGGILPFSMDFCHDFKGSSQLPEAYERLIKDGLEGDSTFFTRWDEVSLAWKIVDPITKAWEESQEIPLFSYAAGQWGPIEAKELLERDGFKWWPVFGEPS